MNNFEKPVATTNMISGVEKNNKDSKCDYEWMNPLKGKKVIFVENEGDPINADGVKGHLEAVGESEHKAGVYEKYIKRGMDVILSFGGLVVLSPVLLGISLAIVIDDPGPVLFTQKRIGQNKKYFKLHKFRSMKMSTPHDRPTHMLDNPEQYITKVGKFIRAHSLDELPQIWDIFIGERDIIGTTKKKLDFSRLVMA
jgi:O-antigen biosynthesis protein WbqP